MRNLKKNLSTLEPLLDMNTVALLIGCSVSTVTRMCDDGSLPYVIVHRGKRKLTRKIRPSSLSAFLSGNTSSLRPIPEGNGGTNLPPPILPVPQFHPGGEMAGYDGSMPPPMWLLPGAEKQEPTAEDDSGITDEQIMAILDESEAVTEGQASVSA